MRSNAYRLLWLTTKTTTEPRVDRHGLHALRTCASGSLLRRARAGAGARGAHTHRRLPHMPQGVVAARSRSGAGAASGRRGTPARAGRSHPARSARARAAQRQSDGATARLHRGDGSPRHDAPLRDGDAFGADRVRGVVVDSGAHAPAAGAWVDGGRDAARRRSRTFGAAADGGGCSPTPAAESVPEPVEFAEKSEPRRASPRCGSRPRGSASRGVQAEAHRRRAARVRRFECAGDASESQAREQRRPFRSAATSCDATSCASVRCDAVRAGRRRAAALARSRARS